MAATLGAMLAHCAAVVLTLSVEFILQNIR